MAIPYVPSVQLIKALRRSLNFPRYRLSAPVCSGSKVQCRALQSIAAVSPTATAAPVPLRKQLKDEAKARRLAEHSKDGILFSKAKTIDDRHGDKWELTVGIEVHAELNTAAKLFSPASTSLNDIPNTHVSAFDAALPGAQPQFQQETLLPALRAALALGCDIQPKSTWDRKHYFWWDQPNGYQITQYYEPFAKDGSITLFAHDDIDPRDHPSITIGIKQIQMEQDTAKTVLQPPSTHLVDFNRVSHPLIEIITLPQIHSPKTAAALVRKIQSILKAVNASTTGMEMGGLRADVNVSVRQRSHAGDGRTGVADVGHFQYAGVTGLGQRTEIKNLSSFKAVEDAIVAERDRQIAVLEAGGVIEGETRGWTLGSTETRRLRGKEGEVDYRYMPDPDLGAVVIGNDLLSHLKETLPPLPDETLQLLTQESIYGLTMKDAKTLLNLDDGDRIDYYFAIVDRVLAELVQNDPARQKTGRLVANWLLHHLPASAAPSTTAIPALSSLLTHLLRNQITLPTAKALLPRILDTPTIDLPSIISQENLLLEAMSEEEYIELAKRVIEANKAMADKVKMEVQKRGKSGKVMWFVGQMVREGEEGRVQPERAEGAVRTVFGLGRN